MTRPPVLTVAERLLGLVEKGQMPRMQTRIPSLDTACRGGFPLGRLAIFAAPPGAGKTTHVGQLGFDWALEGHHVAVLAADEGADAIATRWAQALEYSRDDLDAGNEFACRHSGSKIAARASRLFLFDAEQDGATIDSASMFLTEQTDNAPSVLIVDSIQVARAEGTDAARDQRHRAEIVIAALKRARGRGQLVLATSELSRSAYKSNRKDDGVNLLAAAKESGAIEYAADLLMVMQPVADEIGLVDCELVKCRFGRKASFRLRQDFDRATFSEVERTEPLPAESASEAIDRGKGRVRMTLAQHHDLRSASSVAARAGGRKADTLDAIRELVEAGEVITVDGCLRLAAEAA